MSNTYQLTPPVISKLPQDILWHTFYFIAQRPLKIIIGNSNSEHSALNNLRHISQVCASWRELVLTSSSLWGMCIELDSLSQRTGHWRDEVLLRTGQSLLDIQGHSINIRVRNGLDKFLVSLLDVHWPRIRKLDITFQRLHFNPGHNFVMEAMRSAFQKPALHLECVRVHFSLVSKLSKKDFSPTTFRLFADQAPVLREFTGLYFRVYPQKPWLSNLRVLRLTCQWTALEFLDSLACMPLLEILGVTEEEKIDQPVIGRASLPQLRLPQLKELDVDTGVALTKHLAILEHLLPASGFHFSLQTNVLPLIQTNLVAIQSVLCSYLQLSFQDEFPHHLEINMYKDYILVNLSKVSRKFSFEFEFEETSRIFQYSSSPLVQFRSSIAENSPSISGMLLQQPPIQP